MLLPNLTTEADYRAVFKDDSVWLSAIRGICELESLDAECLERPILGTNVVFRTKDRIIKLFPLLWAEDGIAEMAVLPGLSGLPTPQVISSGELEGWPYLILTVAEGVPAMDVWEKIPYDQQVNLMRDLGALIRKLHDHAAIPEISRDWNAFLAERIAVRQTHHHTVDDSWRRWIDERLDSFTEPPFEPVLLNADLTEDHLLLSIIDGRWTITGLIDFGDAMMGHPLYEFVAPVSFYTFGVPELTRTLLESYGIQPTPEIAERMTTYCLLHQYGSLQDFLDRHPVPDGEAFHRALWGPDI